MTTKTNLIWLLQMAWRDSRRNRGRLLLFISSIVVGIAALVAINSFGENLQNDINREAKSLLGADLELTMTQLPSDTILALFDSIGGEQSRTTSFVSMALFPKTNDTRLVYIRALEGGFPFYGSVSTIPKDAYGNFRTGQKALVDKNMMIQYGLAPGDTVKVGRLSFPIEGQITSTPGRAGIAANIAPVIFIPMAYLEQTGLVQRGSRIEYAWYFRFDESTVVGKLMESVRPALRAASIRDTTVSERKEDLGEAFGNLNSFLSLVSFIALLLGCIGVAGSVHIYIKDKIAAVAVLRCLGATGRQAFLIYLLQIAAMGLLGAISGAVLGSLLQLALPAVLEDFLPISEVSRNISWSSMWEGILTGLGIAVLFALLPLLSVRKISPLRTLRSSFEEEEEGRDPLRWLVYGLIFLFILGFSWMQTGGERESVFFPLAIGAGFLLLAGLARFVMWAVRRFFPTSWSYLWRQSLANLYRPNNQTLILIVSIGLGTFLLSTLFFTRDLLLDQVRLSGSGDRPNMILFDIQPQQLQEVADLTRAHDLPVIQQVPIVTMRMESVDGKTKAANDQDSLSRLPSWVFNREYRVTYRDTLIDSEKLVEGQWHGEKEDDGNVYISLADNVADDMKAKVGSRLTFDVQGAPVETIVSSIRKVDFNRVQTNFLVVFPTGVLEKAPQFNVIVTRTASPDQSAPFQRELVQAFPNVSVIELGQILRTVDDILGKVSFVIQFMAMFSIITGLLVLVSSVILSKYQRIRESVLLRTIGASRRQILWINALEYLILGSLAALTGILLSVAGSWLLAAFVFEIPFRPAPWQPLITMAVITGLTVLIGLFNSREVVSLPPLEVLRSTDD
jgi:putative ABC transport system permease protein